jgi:RNA polymerase sigma factor for flagellar operon FliA
MGNSLNRAERNRLVLDNLPLVGYLVSEVSSKVGHHDRDDLASAGAVALVQCAESFDPALGVPFGAYARRRILGAFSDEMRASDWATRTARSRINESSAVTETLSQTLGRSPTVDEVAQAMGVDRTIATTALTDATRTVAPLDELTAGSIAGTIDSPEHSILLAEQSQYLRTAVASLPEKMRHIVTQVYLEERPVKDVAEELGLSHAAISQQRAEGIRLLGEALQTHYGHAASRTQASERRISAPRRNAYLNAVAERTLGGITRGPDPVASSAGAR